MLVSAVGDILQRLVHAAIVKILTSENTERSSSVTDRTDGQCIDQKTYPRRHDAISPGGIYQIIEVDGTHTGPTRKFGGAWTASWITIRILRKQNFRNLVLFEHSSTTFSCVTKQYLIEFRSNLEMEW